MLFIWVVVIDLVVGVAQEVRAKRTLERLTILGRTTVRVRRDGLTIGVAAQFVVAAEVILAGRGEQLPSMGWCWSP